MEEALIIIGCVLFVAAGGGTATVLTRSRRRGARAAGPVPGRPSAPGRVTPGRAAPVRPAPARPPTGRPPSDGRPPTPGNAPATTPATAPVAAPPSVPTTATPAVPVEAPPAEVLVPPEGEAGPGQAGPGEAAALLERPRFRDRLGKARGFLAGHLAGIRGRDKLDEQTWEELEEALILADVGITTTEELLSGLKARARQDGITSSAGLMAALRHDLAERLAGDRELAMAPKGATTVWLFVGVNGVGKTTTIGKLAMAQLAGGQKVVLAAGDTFRAAAADQLQVWAERVGANFVRGNEGGDPGAVVFDAVQHANARGYPLVLADTAGRLHTKVNLMEELKKVRRVADRPPGQVTEVLLVIDATTGQNGLIQARQFAEAVGVTGVVLTKLDGTAKGGIAVAIAGELGIPIKLVGLGETAADLVPFDADEFVDALVPDE
jgi:fused signal recognition particle receptor